MSVKKTMSEDSIKGFESGFQELIREKKKSRDEQRDDQQQDNQMNMKVSVISQSQYPGDDADKKENYKDDQDNTGTAAEDQGIYDFLKKSVQDKPPISNDMKLLEERKKMMQTGKGSQSSKRKQGSAQKKSKQSAQVSEREVEDQLYKVKDENDNLKRKQLIMEEHFKKMNAQLSKQDLDKHRNQKKTHSRSPDNQDKQLLAYQTMKVEQLQEENKQLKEKLQAFSQNQKVISTSKTAEDGSHKRLYKAIGQEDVPRIKQDNQKVHDLLSLVDLLKKQLRDSEENNKKMQSMLQSKVVTTKDQHEKNQKLIGIQVRYEELSVQYEKQQKMLEQARASIVELSMDNKDKAEQLSFKDTKVYALEQALKNANDLEAELQQEKRQRMEIESRLRELSQSPFFAQHTDTVNKKQDIQKLEQELIKMKEISNMTNQDSAKLLMQVDQLQIKINRLEKELNQTQEQNAAYKVKIDEQSKVMAPFRELQKMNPEIYLKALGQVKMKSEEPLYKKVSELGQYNDAVEVKQIEDQDITQLQKTIEQLKYEKGELAAHLEKTQTMLATRIDIEKEKDKLHTIELEKVNMQLKAALARADELAKLADMRAGGGPLMRRQLIKTLGDGQNLDEVKDGEEEQKDEEEIQQSRLRQKNALATAEKIVEGGTTQFYEKNGVKYSDNVSVFSIDETEDTEASGNFLDLWIGNNVIVETNLKQLTEGQIKDSKKILTFITIDFYNHETQHTNIAEGLTTCYNFQIAFKVSCDEFFITFLEQGFLKFDLFAAAGAIPILLGQVNIPLRNLVLLNRLDNISAVISESIQIYSPTGSNQKLLVCCLEYKMRMRKPLYNTIAWMEQKSKLDIISKPLGIVEGEHKAAMKRRLVIIVEKGVNLPHRTNCFVYYNFDGQDYYSGNQPGPNPTWGYNEVINVNYNEEMATHLRNQPLTITVFDDQVTIDQEAHADIIGLSKINLTGITQNQILDVNVDVRDQLGKIKGNLIVKIFWYEANVAKEKLKREESLLKKTWEQDVTIQIATALRKRHIGLQTAFLIFDRNQDQVISIEDFEGTVLGTLNMPISKDQADVFFTRLPTPLNQINFEIVFGQYLQSQAIINNEEQQQKGGQEQATSLQNYNQRQQQILVQALRQRVNQLFERKLSMGVKYFELFNEIDQHGDGFLSLYDLKTYLSSQNIDANEEDVYEFLSIMDQDNDGKISLEEFMDFVLGESRRNELNKMRQLKGLKPITEGYKLDLLEQDPSSKNVQSQLEQMSNQDAAAHVLNDLLDYMKRKKITFNRLHTIIDKDKSQFISQPEFYSFLKKELNVTLSQRELDTLVNYFDTNHDGHVDILEFIQGMENLAKSSNKKEMYRPLFAGQRQELEPSTQQQLIDGIAAYMKQQNLKPAALFQQLDVNSDGLLSKAEFKQVLQKKMKIQFDEPTYDQVFDHFDIDKGDRISISEFVTILKPYLDQSVDQTYPQNTNQKSTTSFSGGSKKIK